jgi:hypothetical protein
MKEPCAVPPDHHGPLTPEECAQRVLGGEASMWSERIDVTNLDAFVWPRTCGVAERLWSAGDATAADYYDSVSQRYGAVEQQRCRLVVRGIGAGPTEPQSQGNYADGLCSLPPDWSPLGPRAAVACDAAPK